MIIEFLLPPATKWGQDYIFIGVCDSVHGGGGGVGGIPACIAGGIPACLALGGGAIPACLAAGGACYQGGAWSGGSALGGLFPGGWLLETPPDGHCCWRYASYWNAFLFPFFLQDHLWVIICEPCEILTRIGICGFRLFGFPTCDFLSVIKINTTLRYVTYH